MGVVVWVVTPVEWADFSVLCGKVPYAQSSHINELLYLGLPLSSCPVGIIILTEFNEISHHVPQQVIDLQEMCVLQGDTTAHAAVKHFLHRVKILYQLFKNH